LNKADLILKHLLKYFTTKSVNETVIYLSADHGEGLVYHKYLPLFGHLNLLTYETINIPLIILDSNPIKVIRDKYSTKNDLLPTIVDRCFFKYKLPDETYSGRSLYSEPDSLRYTFHSLYINKYQDFYFAIIKDSLGVAVEKYLYDPAKRQDFIFSLGDDKFESDTIVDKNRLMYYRHKKSEYLNH